MIKCRQISLNVVNVCVLLVLIEVSLAFPTRSWAGYASLIMDADDGLILHADSADDLNHPASLTKMMTLYLLFQALTEGRITLATQMTVSTRAAIQPPSKLNLTPESSLTVEKAILALITKSANDVAYTVAETLGGNEEGFAEIMTYTARRLGMYNTVFLNASGLPNKLQLTTARDMAILGRAMVKHHSRYYHYFSTRYFRYGESIIPTHNRLLLNCKGVDGIKTGYIASSGFNLVTSAKRDGRRLVGVVLGAATARWRDTHMAHLLDVAFSRLTQNGAPFITDEPGRQLPLQRIAITSSHGSEQQKISTSKFNVVGTIVTRNWGIQLSYFRKTKVTQESINSVVRKIKPLRDKHFTVEPVGTRNSFIYKARLAGITQREARSICEYITRVRDLPVALVCHVIRQSGTISTDS